jgi:hypothetical protein
VTLPLQAELGDLDAELPSGPYPGLRPFEKAEWPIFFGRERMTEEVISRLVSQRLLVIHGDSGCGKSSLIYAGVLPRLEQEAARGGTRWLTAAAAPGEQPLWNLALSLSRLPGNSGTGDPVALRRALNFGADAGKAISDFLKRAANDHLCILIDQFEELFSHAKRSDSNDAKLLIEFMLGVLERRPAGIYVVVTMRSEFLGACAKFPGFAEAVNRTQYLLPRMDHADLVRAVREPATLFGGQVTRELADRLIEDAGGSQDQLPLIQHGLMLLHRRNVVEVGREHQSWKLGREHYDTKSGDLGALLSTHADEVAAEFKASPTGTRSRVVEDIFRCLTDINADGQAIRRPRTLRELVAVAGVEEARVRSVIDAFRAPGVSLLRPYGNEPLALDDRVDISHEALIRCWKCVADPEDGWLVREFKNGLIWRSLLVQVDSFERDRSNVLSATTTLERHTWLKRRNAAWCARYGGGWERVGWLIDESMLDFKRREAERLAAAKDAEEAHLRERMQEHRLQEQKRATRNLRAVTLIVVTLALTAFVLAGVAFREQGKAEAALQAAAAAASASVAADQRSVLAYQAQALAETREKERQRATEATFVGLSGTLEELRDKAGDDKTRQAIEAAQAALVKQAETQGIATVVPKSRLLPRIYTQISEPTQRTTVTRLVELLNSEKVNGVAPVTIPPAGLQPSGRNILRCFRADECDEGKELVRIANSHLVEPKLVLDDWSKKSAKPSRSRVYEIWFSRGEIRLAR